MCLVLMLAATAPIAAGSVAAEHRCLQAEGPATAVVSLSVGASDTRYDVGTQYDVVAFGAPGSGQFRELRGGLLLSLLGFERRLQVRRALGGRRLDPHRLAITERLDPKDWTSVRSV